MGEFYWIACVVASVNLSAETVLGDKVHVRACIQSQGREISACNIDSNYINVLVLYDVS